MKNDSIFCYNNPYGYKQTDHSDKFDMSVITDNMDILDTTIADIIARLEALEGKEQKEL